MSEALFYVLFIGIPAAAVILFIVSLVMFIITLKKPGKWKKWLVLMIVSFPIVAVLILFVILLGLINMGVIRFM